MTLLSKISSKGDKKTTSLFGSHWLYILYLAGVSAISIIIISVNLGITLTNVGKFLLITDEEYILSGNAWEVRACSEPKWVENASVEKTPEEIVECETKATITALAARSVNLKETFITSFAWVFVFAILFGFHYPKFVAERNRK